MIDFSIDGRLKLQPPEGALGASPAAMKAATCRLVIREFEESGRSYHSAAGSTLWMILEHCRQNKIPFTLEHMPGMGYQVTKKEHHHET